jgi:NitT/TauT family transport system substrate-binding protein
MIGRRPLLALLAGAIVATVQPTTDAAEDLGALRVGVLAFGTVNWELDVIKHHGLDKREGFTLEVQPFGGNDAADVALLGGAVDAIVEDWLWVSRQRAEGVPLTWIPYSSSVGALMVRGDSDIQSLADLEGKRVGIAGGPLDKGWLLIRTVAADQSGIDLASAAEPVYAAPPLLSENLRSGGVDAVLTYWHFAARLEADGHRRLFTVADAQEALGVPGDTPQLGYIFEEAWADEHSELVLAFARASRAAKEILDTSDGEWERLRPLTKAENDAVLETLQRRYREGIVRSWGEKERVGAAELYARVAQLGGPEVVGRSDTLVEGTFWPGLSY